MQSILTAVISGIIVAVLSGLVYLCYKEPSKALKLNFRIICALGIVVILIELYLAGRVSAGFDIIDLLDKNPGVYPLVSKYENSARNDFGTVGIIWTGYLFIHGVLYFLAKFFQIKDNSEPKISNND